MKTCVISFSASITNWLGDADSDDVRLRLRFFRDIAGSVFAPDSLGTTRRPSCNLLLESCFFWLVKDLCRSVGGRGPQQLNYTSVLGRQAKGLQRLDDLGKNGS